MMLSPATKEKSAPPPLPSYSAEVSFGQGDVPPPPTLSLLIGFGHANVPM
jgi:hypothetical protein